MRTRLVGALVLLVTVAIAPVLIAQKTDRAAAKFGFGRSA